MRRALSIIIIASLGLAACGSGSKSDPHELVVFAASSLTEVFQKIERAARYNFAASDQLATQIREGARVDIYAAASPKYPTQLAAEGLVEQPVAFATNRIVLIVPAANPAHLTTVGDLRRRGIKLVIGAAGVPIGDYTRTLLTNLKATDVLRNVVSEEQEVKGVIGKVGFGEADAGFVYATDVVPAGDKVRAIDVPAGAQPGVSYVIAIVKNAAHPDAARAFIAMVQGARGKQALGDAGFGLP